MALAPGEARKDLSADAIFRALRCRFGSLLDPRSDDRTTRRRLFPLHQKSIFINIRARL